MDLIGLVAFIAIVPFVAGLLAMELYDTSDRVARNIILRVVHKLPPEAQERYTEEWLAHLDEQGGKLARLLAAAGIAASAAKVGAALRAPVPASRVSSPQKQVSWSLAARVTFVTPSRLAVFAAANLVRLVLNPFIDDDKTEGRTAMVFGIVAAVLGVVFVAFYVFSRASVH